LKEEERQREKERECVCRAVSGRTGWRMKRKSLPAGVYRKFHKKKGSHVHVQPSKRVRLPDFATTDGCTDSFWGRILIRPKIAAHMYIYLYTQVARYIESTSEIARFLWITDVAKDVRRSIFSIANIKKIIIILMPRNISYIRLNYKQFETKQSHNNLNCKWKK